MPVVARLRRPAARKASLRHTDRYYGDVVPVSVVADAWAKAPGQ